jgi:hypothetical protein
MSNNKWKRNFHISKEKLVSDDLETIDWLLIYDYLKEVFFLLGKIHIFLVRSENVLYFVKVIETKKNFQSFKIRFILF